MQNSQPGPAHLSVARAALSTPVSFLILIFVLLLIWVPVVIHYYVPTPSVSQELIDAARTSPSDEKLEELTRLFVRPIVRGEQQLAAAEHALNGQIDVLLEPLTVQMPFDADALENASSGGQLFLASLGVPELLVDGYETSGRPEFLRAATESIVAFADFERQAWFPKGLMWNDHAIARRIHVLSEFWKVYRKSPEFRPEVARIILEQAARCGQILARASNFTFATNHGVMQNLALWHGSLAFPRLPAFDEYGTIASQRLHDQMSFYINEEGAVLEHSSSYHLAGLQFLAEAFWYMAALGESIPAEWIQKYERAREFYAQLRRPDGSLPLLGDTGTADDSGPFARFAEHGSVVTLQRQDQWGPPQPQGLYPAAGYSVWWDGLAAWPDSRALAQTTVNWSYFKGHGHKHADELSVLLWAGGESWWSSVGYWPDGDERWPEATSWDGSNAPHLIGEPLDSPRSSKLLGYGYSGELSAIDIERRGPDDYSVRRQIVRVLPNIWLVLDHVSGVGEYRTTWSTSNTVTMEPGTITGSYVLNGSASGRTLNVFPIGSPGLRLRQVNGSLQPFAGWEVVDGRPVPVPALIVEQPAGETWTGVVWQLNGSANDGIQLDNSPQLTWGKDATDWSAYLPTREGGLEIIRLGDSISIASRGSSDWISPVRVNLAVESDTEEKVDRLRQNFAEVSAKYPTSVPLGYRRKISWALLLGFFVQEVFVLRPLRSQKKVLRYARTVALCIWAIGAVLIGLYFSQTVDLLARII